MPRSRPQVGRFSPHTRGCSSDALRPQMLIIVFPAYAGMFRLSSRGTVMVVSFPRIRGDVPNPIGLDRHMPTFSPHTRGCSWFVSTAANDPEVFPAYAGMFLLGDIGALIGEGFPRIRGDVPSCVGAELPNSGFSPHTRGCSLRPRQEANSDRVFPAYAGMFRRI